MKAEVGHEKISCLVVGSGAGGLTTAITLARAGKQVVVLEEGLRKSGTSPFSLGEVQSDYRNGGQVLSLSSSPHMFGEGRVLGGGTAVNSGYYLRPRKEKVDEFRRAWKIEDFSPESWEGDFSALEKEISPSTSPSYEWISRENWSRASAACGLSVEDAQFSHRWNPATKKFERRSLFDLWGDELQTLGAEIRSDSRVRRIQKSGAGWIVEVCDGRGLSSTVKAETIFLCAGTVQTPALLRRSGYYRNLGNNFQFHIFVRALARFPYEINKERCPVLAWKAGDGNFTIGHSPDYPHLLALSAPALSGKLKTDWAHWSVFYASVPTSSGKKVRPWGNEALIFSRLSRKERRDTASAFYLLKKFTAELGAEFSEPKSFTTRFLQSVHLFGSCPMGGDPRISATDSWGRLHGEKSLRIHDASLLGSSLGQNPQASVMAMARRNTLHFLSERK